MELRDGERDDEGKCAKLDRVGQQNVSEEAG